MPTLIQNWWLLFLIFCLNFNGITQVSPSFKKLLDSHCYGFPTISTLDAVNELNTSVFIDAREFKEFKISHIPNAIFLGFNKPIWKNLNNISKDKKIIVYCSIGVRSKKIAKKIKQKGYKETYNLYGGIFQWSNESHPLVKLNNKKTKNIHGYSKEWGKWIKNGKIFY